MLKWSRPSIGKTRDGPRILSARFDGPPQPRRSIEPKWNAEAKDRLERVMCEMVCGGQLDIATAQEAFAKDWIAAYHKYYEAH